MVIARPYAALLLCSAVLDTFRSPAQSVGGWYVQAAANYTWCADPLGAGHGPYTGHGAGGASWAVGGGYERTPSPFGVCAEIQLEQRAVGYEFNEDQYNFPQGFLADGLDKGRRTMRTAQLQFPVLLAYRGFPGLRLEAGPVVGRLIRALELRRGIRYSNGREETLFEQEDRTTDLATWEFLVMAGALVEGPRGVHVHLRYVSGFSNMDVGPGSSPSFTKQVQVALVYAFGHRGSGGLPTDVLP